MTNTLENLYNVTPEDAVAQDSTSYIQSGIHENVLFTDVKYEITAKGNEFLAFYFKDKDGDVLSHTEWPSTPKKDFESMNSKEKEDFYKKVQNQRKRIAQIVTAFVPKEQYDFTSKSFKEFAETIVKLLTPSINVAKVRVKVVYNDKGFTTLPNYNKPRFIESMDIPASESKIKILDLDQKSMVRVRPNVTSKLAEDLLDELETQEKIGDEIPF